MAENNRFILIDGVKKGTHSGIWDNQKQNNQRTGDELWIGEVVGMLNEGAMIAEANKQLKQQISNLQEAIKAKPIARAEGDITTVNTNEFIQICQENNELNQFKSTIFDILDAFIKGLEDEKGIDKDNMEFQAKCDFTLKYLDRLKEDFKNPSEFIRLQKMLNGEEHD